MSNPGPSVNTSSNNVGVLYDPITGNIFADGIILNLGGTTVNSITTLQTLVTSAVANPTLNYGASITSPITVPANLTIPSNVQLNFAGPGRLVWGSGVTITNNGIYTAGPWQIWDISASGAVWAGMAQSSTGRMMVEHFGALGDDTNDDTAAFNFCATVAATTLSDIQLLGRTYRLTSTVFADTGTGANATWGPNWYGSSAIKTVMHGVGLAAQAGIFQVRGGSGTYTQAGFYDMTFLGDGSPCGVVMLGKGSTWCYRCRFDNLYSGIRLWNKDSGSFTEFCGGDTCWFRGNCTYHLEFMVTGGQNSFRGSGFKGHGLSNIATAGTGVLIGTGAKMYNAIMDHEVASTGTTTFIQNNSTQPTSFSGQINTETSGGVCTLGAGNRIWFTGKESHSGENVAAGTLIQCDTIIFNTDSSPTPIGMRKQFTAALTTGANTIGVSGVNGSGVGWSGGIQRLVSLQLTNANIAQYDCRYVFEIDINSAISSSGAVNPAIAGSGIRVLREINTLAYGSVSGAVGTGTQVTLTVNSSGQLVVTGASFPVSGVTAYWEEKQISNNLTAFHPQI